MIIKQAVFMTFLVAYPEQGHGHATGNRLPRTPSAGDHPTHPTHRAFHGASDTKIAPVNADYLLDQWLQPKSACTTYLDASYAELAKTS